MAWTVTSCQMKLSSGDTINSTYQESESIIKSIKENSNEWSIFNRIPQVSCGKDLSTNNDKIKDKRLVHCHCRKNRSTTGLISFLVMSIIMNRANSQGKFEYGSWEERYSLQFSLHMFICQSIFFAVLAYCLLGIIIAVSVLRIIFYSFNQLFLFFKQSKSNNLSVVLRIFIKWSFCIEN